MLKIMLLILFAEIWGTIGQILYKKSANKVETPNLRSPRSYLEFVKALLKLPTIWFGLFFIGMGLLAFLIPLAQADLSLVFPIDSMQYLVTLVGAHIFLNEKINALKLMGTLLVMAGIILVAIS